MRHVQQQRNLLSRDSLPLFPGLVQILAVLRVGPRHDLVAVGRTLAVLHIIRPSRGKAVVQHLFDAIQPMVWVSGMLGSQRGYGVEWQVCLAHLLRDARYAVECGDAAFSAAFKLVACRRQTVSSAAVLFARAVDRSIPAQANLSHFESLRQNHYPRTWPRSDAIERGHMIHSLSRTGCR